MKRTYLTALLLASAFTLQAAPALASAEKPEVAIVNIQRIMADSTVGKSIREQLEAKQKSFRTEFSKKEESLQKEKQELSKQNSVLSKDAFEEKKRAFEAKMTEAQKDFQNRRGQYDKAFDGAIVDVQKTVNEIIGDIAKEKGFMAAFPTSQTLYFDPKLEISDEVLSRLNKKLATLTVKFDEK